MAGLTLKNVTKCFDDFVALKDISLEIADGEFVAVLGPSGCGKTTLLRIIAGFEKITGGQIHVGGHLFSDKTHHVAPEARKIGIVFQNYALWPHMSVAENVGYGLKIAKVPRRERDRRIAEALDLVDMSGFCSRRPAELSGGQRQRVALARCLVNAPSLVLFDEPLANLDVHLRAAMEEEFAAFHRRIGATILYITHDQAEAMALADRIAVIDAGHLMQFDSPRQLYNEPQNEMVARFIAGGMVLPADILSNEVDGQVRIRILGQECLARCQKGERPRSGAKLCLRPSDLDYEGARFGNEGSYGISLQVNRIIYRSGGLQIRAHPTSQPGFDLNFTIADDPSLHPGQEIKVRINSGWIIPS